MTRHGSHRIWTRWIVSSAIAIAVVGIVFFYRGNLILTLRRIQPLWVLAGFGAYLLNYVFRALRLKVLSPVTLPFWPGAMHGAALHGFATYMLPVRSGDLALPFILKSTINLALKDGTLILFKSRLLDVVTIGGWVLAAAVCWPDVFHNYLYRILYGIGFLMILSPLLLRVGIKLIASLGGAPRRFALQTNHIGMLRPVELIMSIGVWSALGTCFYCIAHAVGLSIEFGVIWLVIVVQLPLQLIPIQGIANSGNHEGGWVAALMLVGVGADAAVEFALASHAVLLLYVLIIGCLALISGHFDHR